MQIPPSTSVLRAFSQAPEVTVRPHQGRITSADAGREAARAVFANLKPPSAAVANVAAAPTSVQTAPPSIPATPPNKPLPRGSIVNILV